MKLTDNEYKSLVSWMRKHNDVFLPIQWNLVVGNLNPKRFHQDLKSLGRTKLEMLIEHLPSGKTSKVTSPLLSSVRSKAKTSLAGLRTPHLDPESYPQVYRMMMKLNNSRAGLRDGTVGQIMRLNPKAMSVRLRGEIIWDSSNGGDLHIMGTWSDISNAIAGGGDSLVLKTDFDLYKGDVNAEMDDLYGPLPGDDPTWEERKNEMPLVVSCQLGAMWSKTDKEGEVVLNAPKAVIELVAGRATGVLGQIPAATIQSVTLDTIGTIGPPALDLGREIHSATKTVNPNKALYTVTVGIGPVGEHYVIADDNEIDGAELLRLAREARPT